ncbi:MAG TPA: phosphatidylserine decarboxylase [Gammaproteobacteria bacterium]|nr:phosphatidylserine decarboxylase [Gammaproteobacteria bacterium]
MKIKPLVLFQTLLPQHGLSRIMHWLMRCQKLPGHNFFLRWAIRKYKIQLDEILEPDLFDRHSYPDLNSCFTRALKPEARPVAPDELDVCCPADGTISEIGYINDTRLLQAKGREYTLTELLGGNNKLIDTFRNGAYATIYLSPSDYHRVHMPYNGKLTTMIHVPGRLFSVSPWNMKYVPRLFARNERVISVFNTVEGSMAVIMVGAIFVGSIETVWEGEITPPAGKKISTSIYPDSAGDKLGKGDEMGRFNMGSTVIVLFTERAVEWHQDRQAGTPVKMGQILGKLTPVV